MCYHAEVTYQYKHCAIAHTYLVTDIAVSDYFRWTLSVSLLVTTTGIFQDNSRKLVPECYHSGFYWSKDNGSGTGAIRRAKLQSDCHHQQTNTQFFTCQMPFLSPNQQCQSTERELVSSLISLKPVIFVVIIW